MILYHNISYPLSNDDSVVKIKQTMYGKTDCGNCVDLESWTKDISSKTTVPIEYNHVDIDNDNAGKEYAEKHKVDGIPASEICEVYKSGKEECSNYIGPDAVKERLSKYIKKEVV